nr:putative glycoside hydrolase [Candidatus Krumholzibacteria bacterium]
MQFAWATRGQKERTGYSLPFCALVLAAVLAGPFSVQAQEDIVHSVKPGDTLIKICSRYRAETNHYSLSELMNDIRGANELSSNLLQIGQKLVIPVLPAEEAPKVIQTVADGHEVRAIYLTGPACGVSSLWRRVDSFIAAGGNAVVFDAKDIDGGISYLSEHPLATWGKGRSVPVISSVSEMMKRFDDRGLYVIARLALFLDGELGRQRPDLALQDAQGAPWTERGCVWMNAAAPEVRQFNLALAKELAAAGVDEIQFDYVRFPTNGWREDWNAQEEPDLEQVAAMRRGVIASFLREARAELDDHEVRISADLYGIMAWGRMEDLALTGQHVPTFAELVDVICPMIYPSHFGAGFEGRRRPGDDPEYFIGEGTRRFVEMAAGQAEIRPWLQAFPYRVSNYDGQYISTQVLSSRQAGGAGWSLWNPACRYQVAVDVLPGLCDLETGIMVASQDQIQAGASTEVAITSPAATVPATLLGAMVNPSVERLPLERNLPELPR